MGSDARRTFVVLGDEVDLFAALRPLLDSAMLQVRWSPAAASEGLIASCAPWPWGVAGAGGERPGSARRLLAGKPVLWFWLGEPPALVADARTHARWRALADDVKACVARSVGGVRLAPNRGLVGPGGQLVLSAELEGLLSSSPAPLTMSANSCRAAARAVARYSLPVLLHRENGRARLEAG